MADINFGILDTQLPGRIAAIPQEAQKQQTANMLQAMQMQGTMNQNALSQYTLSKAKREDELTNQLLGDLRGATTDAEIYRAYQRAGKGKEASELQSAALTRQKLAGEILAQPDDRTYRQAQTRKLKHDEEIASAQHAYENLSRLSTLAGGASDEDISAVIGDAVRTQGLAMSDATRLQKSLLALPLEQRSQRLALLAGSASDRLRAITPDIRQVTTPTGGVDFRDFSPFSPGFGRTPAGFSNLPPGMTQSQSGMLTVAQRNADTNEARVELLRNAPRLGLTDPEDIDRVAEAVASGRIPVDRLNSGTAKIYAGLLKADPTLDFNKTSIDQAVAKKGAVTTARIGAEQTRTTSLTPEMIQQAGEAYNTNGKLPSLGSGPQAAVDRVAILRYASENNPTDATTKALNKAQLDALGPLAKQEAAVTNYVKTFDKNIELARAALTKVSNTNIPALNAWLLNPAQRQLTGNPDLKALGVYVSSLQAEFAKIQSGAMGNSVTADAAIKRAQDTINAADSPRAFRAALDAMVKESRNRIDSFEDTRKEMAAKVRGQPAPTAPAAAATPAPGWGKAEAK